MKYRDIFDTISKFQDGDDACVSIGQVPLECIARVEDALQFRFPEDLKEFWLDVGSVSIFKQFPLTNSGLDLDSSCWLCDPEEILDVVEADPEAFHLGIPFCYLGDGWWIFISKDDGVIISDDIELDWVAAKDVGEFIEKLFNNTRFLLEEPRDEADDRAKLVAHRFVGLPSFDGEPISLQDVTAAEARLAVKFDDDLKHFWVQIGHGHIKRTSSSERVDAILGFAFPSELVAIFEDKPDRFTAGYPFFEISDGKWLIGRRDGMVAFDYDPEIVAYDTVTDCIDAIFADPKLLVIDGDNHKRVPLPPAT